MYKSIILTTPEYKNEASSLAQQCGGVVIISYNVFIEQNGSFSETESSSTACQKSGLKVVEGYEDCETNATSNYQDIEQALSRTGVMIDPQTYIISSSVDDYDTLFNFAQNINRVTELDMWIIGKDGRAKFIPKL